MAADLEQVSHGRAHAHAITRLHADVDRVLRLERDLEQARRDVEASRRLAAECGAVEVSR